MKKSKSTIESLKEEGLLKSAKDIPVPERKIEVVEPSESLNIDIGIRVNEFCKANKTNEEDLFAWLMENYGKPIKAAKSPKNAQKEDLTEKPITNSKFSSDWRKTYIKNKTGVS